MSVAGSTPCQSSADPAANAPLQRENRHEHIGDALAVAVVEHTDQTSSVRSGRRPGTCRSRGCPGGGVVEQVSQRGVRDRLMNSSSRGEGPPGTGRIAAACCSAPPNPATRGVRARCGHGVDRERGAGLAGQCPSDQSAGVGGQGAGSSRRRSARAPPRPLDPEKNSRSAPRARPGTAGTRSSSPRRSCRRLHAGRRTGPSVVRRTPGRFARRPGNDLGRLQGCRCSTRARRMRQLIPPPSGGRPTPV